MKLAGTKFVSHESLWIETKGGQAIWAFEHSFPRKEALVRWGLFTSLAKSLIGRITFSKKEPIDEIRSIHVYDWQTICREKLGHHRTFARLVPEMLDTDNVLLMLIEERLLASLAKALKVLLWERKSLVGRGPLLVSYTKHFTLKVLLWGFERESWGKQIRLSKKVCSHRSRNHWKFYFERKNHLLEDDFCSFRSRNILHWNFTLRESWEKKIRLTKNVC